MKTFVVALLGLCFCGTVAAQASVPRFTDYPANVYRGKTHIPKWARHIQDNEWRDDLNKLVGPPEINFAGKYFVQTHSLGTGAWYFSMTDLSTGRELNLLDQFITGEERQKLPDGREYSTKLSNRPNSRLLVVRYYIGRVNRWPEPCRERTFILEGLKLRPIGKMRLKCRE